MHAYEFEYASSNNNSKNNCNDNTDNNNSNTNDKVIRIVEAIKTVITRIRVTCFREERV